MIERSVEQVFVDMLSTAFPSIPVRNAIEDDSDYTVLPCFVVSAEVQNVTELVVRIYNLTVRVAYMSRPDIETESGIVTVLEALDEYFEAPVAPSNMTEFTFFGWDGVNKATQQFHDSRRSSVREIGVTVQYS